MESKYYTPTIEEFYVGFEYEILENGIWNKETINESNDRDYGNTIITTPYELEVKDTDVRVKFLDREDIESLGWKFKEIEKGMLSNRPIFEFKTYLLNFDRNEHGIWLLITDEYVEYQHFSGQVKNKSELKKLMQMLNIEK